MPLIGREVQQTRLEHDLGLPGVVTLTGPGGVGKTSLALVIYRRSTNSLWVDLSNVDGRDRVIGRLATALDARADTRDLGKLGHALRHLGDRLLILDNAEHVLDAVAEIIQLAREEAPQLRILVTSRELLRLEDEQVIELDPLSADNSRALLLRRIRQRTQEWVPTETDLVSLVLATEGLPLAIEIVSARVQILPVDELCAQMGELPDRRRNRAARHESMDAVLMWSWQRLSTEHQHVLLCLAVTPATVDLTTAVQICKRPKQQVLKILSDLRDQSLLQDHGHMLTLVRGFVLRHSAPEDVASARMAHATQCLQQIATFEQLDPHRQYLALRNEIGLTRLHAAFECTATPEPLMALTLLEHASAVIRSDGPHDQLTEMLRRLPRSTLPSGPPQVRHRIAEMNHLARSWDLPTHTITEAVSEAQAIGDADLEAHAWIFHAIRTHSADAPSAIAKILELTERPELRARALYARLLGCSEVAVLETTMRQIDEEVARGAGQAAQVDALIAAAGRYSSWEPVKALPIGQQALALAQQIGSPYRLTAAHHNLAMAELLNGHVEACLEHAAQAITGYQQTADPINLGSVYENAALALFCNGDLKKSAEYSRRAAALFRRYERPDMLRNLLTVDACHLIVSEAFTDALALLEQPGAHTPMADVPRRFLDAPMANPQASWVEAVQQLHRGTQPSPTDDPLLDAVFGRFFTELFRIRLTLNEDAAQVQIRDQTIDLSRKAAPRILLRAICENHPNPQTPAQLFAAGWPGQNIRPHAALRRVQVAISTLRSLGLKDVVLWDGSHYGLPPSISLTWACS